MLRHFVAGALGAILWAETDGERPLDQNHGLEDISPALRVRLAGEAARFLDTEGVREILRTTEVARECDSAWHAAGHDFILTRNGHGAGFWDGDWPAEIGAKLTELSKTFGQLEVYVGDDGKIYAQ